MIIKPMFYLPTNLLNENKENYNISNEQFIYNQLDYIINNIIYDKKNVLVIDYNYIINILLLDNNNINLYIYINNKIKIKKYDYIIFLINNNNIKIKEIENILSNIYENISIIKYSLLYPYQNYNISNQLYIYINNILTKNKIKCVYNGYNNLSYINLNLIKGFNLLIYNDNMTTYKYYIKMK